MFASRWNQSIIFDSFRSPFVTAVLGPRRVGKSTLVQHYAEQEKEKKWIFLNMDLRAERLRVESDQLESLIEEKARQKISPDSPLRIAIDEAQKCPPLFEQIKVLYDRFKQKPAVKFILTGSGFLTLHQLAAETLAGRIQLLHLREFGLRETASLHEGSDLPVESIFGSPPQEPDLQRLKQRVADLTPHREVLQNSLREQMVWGGLPEVLELETDEKRISYLGNYLQTYLEKDIRDLATLTDLTLYQRMMEIIAQLTGSVREDKRLIEALGCSRDTLKKYRGFLEATLVYRELYPYIGSSLKRLVKSPKGYLTNNGLISYLTGIYDLNALEKTGAVGHRFENWVLREIQTWLDGDPRQSEIYFWRTSGGVEVDLVVARHPVVYPFEVTYGSRIDGRKVRHLEQFLREEKKAPAGFYVYNGPFHYDSGAKIIFLPAWTLG